MLVQKPVSRLVIEQPALLELVAVEDYFWSASGGNNRREVESDHGESRFAR
jgi:hypothetical protein